MRVHVYPEERVWIALLLVVGLGAGMVAARHCGILFPDQCIE